MMTLRHFGHEDAESVRQHLYPGLSEEDIRNMMDEWNSGLYQGRYFEMFAIVSGGRIAGFVSLTEHSRSVVSVGIEVCSSERGKGIAQEAVQMITRQAAEKGYRIILDQVRRDNPAGIRLHEKLGFESDGYVYRNQRNHEVVLYLKTIEPSANS